MKRIIVDYTKVTDELLDIILEEYPDGYRDQDVIKFKNHKNELIEALEIKVGEDIYLVKVGTKLDKAIENYVEDLDNDEVVGAEIPDAVIDIEADDESNDEDDNTDEPINEDEDDDDDE